MFLENRRKKRTLTSTRRQLLDKYMFLKLDGEGRPQDEEGEHEKIEGKIRQYNLSYIQSVAKGEIKLTTTSLAIVKAIESTERLTDTDELTMQLEQSGIFIFISERCSVQSNVYCQIV
ncbi:hypothetical protein DPMN_091831 [Dreissena polymorpha]|uniref:Uncharacterized protein n=1 Tax=Dreissena polymorpha TaxID=45954 RepID=A0A9D4L0V9_DREPO|nr:hypothetical protein DPMN_091831 [Dreissena polymorpha]